MVSNTDQWVLHPTTTVKATTNSYIPTFCNSSRCYHNSYILQYMKNPTPGTGQVTCTQRGQALESPRVQPGTHVAILAPMGLKISNACEVPLSSMAESSPPSVLVNPNWSWQPKILPLVLYPGFNKMSVVTCSCLGAVTRSRTASTGATPSLGVSH